MGANHISLQYYRCVYLGRKDLIQPPVGFEEHLRQHPKDQSAKAGREAKPAVILQPTKVGPRVSPAEVREILQEFSNAKLGVEGRAEERSKVRNMTCGSGCTLGAKFTFF